jgi:hypothetical protein
VFGELVPQSLEGDGASALGVSVLKHGAGQLQELFVAELHTVLLHAGSHYVLQLSMLDQPVTWEIQPLFISSSSYPYPTKWGRYNMFFIMLW